MKAVYKSAKPYLQVGYWSVNATVPVYCEARETKGGYYTTPHIVGTMVNLPESERDRNRSYCFSEGETHDKLTLTDPREILNMRAYIEGMEITEVYCDGDPVEELSNMDPVESELSEELEDDLEDLENDTYNDWDEKMMKRLKC